MILIDALLNAIPVYAAFSAAYGRHSHEALPDAITVAELLRREHWQPADPAPRRDAVKRAAEHQRAWVDLDHGRAVILAPPTDLYHLVRIGGRDLTTTR